MLSIEVRLHTPEQYAQFTWLVDAMEQDNVSFIDICDLFFDHKLFDIAFEVGRPEGNVINCFYYATFTDLLACSGPMKYSSNYYQRVKFEAGEAWDGNGGSMEMDECQEEELERLFPYAPDSSISYDYLPF